MHIEIDAGSPDKFQRSQLARVDKPEAEQHGGAENADFGILRGIVSEPDKAYKALKDNHFAVNVTDVVGISCPNIPGSLAKVLRFLSDEGVFIEYMYSFANGETANVIIRPNDMDNCIRVLTEKKVDLLAASELYKL